MRLGRPPAGDRRTDTGGGPGDGAYQERMSTPWWWYPVVVVIAVILASEFHVADESLTIVVPLIVIVALGVAIVWSVGRPRVQVSAGELRLREAHIPVDLVAAVIALDRTSLPLVVGRHGDPAAFCRVRPWIGTGVQVVLDDPDDPTPYWVISTRHPRRLAEAIRAQRSG